MIVKNILQYIYYVWLGEINANINANIDTWNAECVLEYNFYNFSVKQFWSRLAFPYDLNSPKTGA